jgi:hypothetical protein
MIEMEEIIGRIKELASRVKNHKDNVITEEATKNAFVLPMLQILGYDIFNPTEVRPEFVADLGIKKGEKVDYAIFIKDEVKIIIECKVWSENLDLHTTQLERYFHATPAKFAVLTNGLEYYFYTDLEAENILDKSPFLKIDLENLRENLVSELSKFHKNSFDVNSILTTASTLKYTRNIKEYFLTQLSNPEPDFVKFFGKIAYKGKFTESILYDFIEIVPKALNQVVIDKVTERFQKVLSAEENEDNSGNKSFEIDVSESDLSGNNKIETTQEELDAYNIVRGILAKVLDVNRVFFRDGVSFCSIILDNSKKRLICRLGLSEKNKWIEINVKNETSIERKNLTSISEIYNYNEELRLCALQFIS